MFRGVATVSLDSKNRLVVPARYRDALLVNGGGRVVITADPGQCLLLYPLPEWEPIEKKLNGLSDFNPRTRSLKQLLVGYAHDMDMDSAGRVLLPPMLRKFSELDKNVVLVGQGSKVELWNEARWRGAGGAGADIPRCRAAARTGGVHVVSEAAHVPVMMRPDVAAKNSNFVNYATGNAASLPMVDEAVRNDPGVYPPAEVKAKLFPDLAATDEFTRLVNRSWTKFTTGQ